MTAELEDVQLSKKNHLHNCTRWLVGCLSRNKLEAPGPLKLTNGREDDDDGRLAGKQAGDR